jgi:hypothetical protein
LRCEKPKRHCGDGKSAFRSIGLTKNFYAVRRFFRSMIPSNATPPAAIIDQGEGSGDGADGESGGGGHPVMRLVLIAAPVVASYAPTVLA